MSPVELFETLVPAGLYHEVVDAGATDTDVLEAAGPHEEVIGRLYAQLGDLEGAHFETQGQLVWLHYMDALYFASVGARDAAREAARRGLAIQPGEPASSKRSTSCCKTARSPAPVDVRPLRRRSLTRIGSSIRTASAPTSHRHLAQAPRAGTSHRHLGLGPKFRFTPMFQEHSGATARALGLSGRP